MNLSQLRTELQVILPQPTVSYPESLLAFLNDEMSQLSYQFDLPALKLKRPATLTTTTAEWLYSMSTDIVHPDGYQYQKMVFRATLPADDDSALNIYREIRIIDERDPDHDDSESFHSDIAVEDDAIAVYPLAANTINLWWFRKPIDMVNDNDEPDGLPPEFHYRVLIPRVVLRCFKVWPELGTEGGPQDSLRALQLWTNRLQAGLYGDGGQMGLLDSLRKSRPPRIRGARTGSNLAGADRFSRWW